MDLPGNRGLMDPAEPLVFARRRTFQVKLDIPGFRAPQDPRGPQRSSPRGQRIGTENTTEITTEVTTEVTTVTELSEEVTDTTDEVTDTTDEVTEVTGTAKETLSRRLLRLHSSSLPLQLPSEEEPFSFVGAAPSARKNPETQS